MENRSNQHIIGGETRLDIARIQTTQIAKKILASFPSRTLEKYKYGLSALVLVVGKALYRVQVGIVLHFCTKNLR